MALLWGPEGTILHNDAFSVLAANRQADCIGHPVHQACPDLVAFQEDLLQNVLSGSALSYKDAELTVERCGHTQQSCFDITYSPVRGEDGHPAGVLALLVETRPAVRFARASCEIEAPADGIRLTHDTSAIADAFDAPIGTSHLTADRRDATASSPDPGILRGQPSADAVIGTGPTCSNSLDTIARKDVEAALAESEARFRNMADHSPAIMWITNPDGRHTYLNTRWLDLTGQSEADIENHGWFEAIHPEERLSCQRLFTEAQDRKTPFRVEFRIRTKEAGWRWVLDAAAPRWDADGAFLGFVGSMIDITDRKAAEAALAESDQRFRNMADHAPVMMWVTDASGVSTYHNKVWHDYTGQTPEEALGFGWLGVIDPRDRPEAETTFLEANARRAPLRVEYRIRRADGAWRWVLDAAAPRLGPDGSFLGYIGSVIDITDRKEAELELEQARFGAEAAAQRLRDVLESTTDSVIILDRNWRVQFMNRNATNLVPQLSDAVHQPFWSIFPEGGDGLFGARLLRAVATRQQVSFEAFDPRMAMWMEVHAYPSEDGLSIFFRDVTAKRKIMEDLEYTARHDSLTGLPNRSCFRARLEEHLNRTGDDAGTALLFLDLDQFKAVNDTLGHPAGDKLLQAAAARLRPCLRGRDLIARFAGDEFAILQTDVTCEDDIMSLAQRIIGCLSEPYLLEGREVVVGVSIGVAVAQASGANADDLLKKADIALYRAKSDGRGLARFFEPAMEEAAQKTQTLRGDLREALARGEFLVHYQPVVDFEPMRVTGFAALLRWRHPELGLLHPAEFIALAEETGAIEEIGIWVLREACVRAAAWPEGISLSVNLSARQFRGGGLVATVSDALQASGLAPDRLQLEITESLLLQDGEAVRGTLRALRAWGVRISIDDFGTGYSSLGYLRSFSVDNIKIDRSFVQDLGDNSRTSAILQAVMALAEQLGVSVTAEGIETEVQAERLHAMGCRQGQGFLFSRPVPIEKVDWLISRNWIREWGGSAAGKMAVFGRVQAV
jgi:diguanylate cyclase (GGDEF)-like protein/PAS domain S-box-containing protein